MAINPEDNARLTEQPGQMIDVNRNVLPAVIAAIVNGAGDITGYLPLAAVDQGDGTAILKVDTEIVLNGDVNIGNVKVGSSDGQTTGNKWLKVLPDGSVVSVLHNVAGDPITSTAKDAKECIDVHVCNASDISGSELSVEGKIFASATPTLVLSPAGTQHPVFLLKNPVASGKILRIRNIIVSLIPSAAQKKPTTFRVYLSSTVTADGTSIGAFNKRSDSVLTADATAFHTPTISSNGELIKAIVVEGASFPLEEDFTTIIGEGDNMLITANNIINFTDIHVSVDWAEVDA